MEHCAGIAGMAFDRAFETEAVRGSAPRCGTLAHVPSPAVASAGKVMDTRPLCSHCPVHRGAPYTAASERRLNR